MTFRRRRNPKAFNAKGVLKEHYEQSDLFKWINEQRQANPRDRRWRLMWANPNGGKRDIITASVMKAEGVRRGVPDVSLSFPSGHFHGAYIENKTEDKETAKGGGLKEDQENIILDLIMSGYKVYVCYNSEQAKAAVIDYMSLTNAAKVAQPLAAPAAPITPPLAVRLDQPCTPRVPPRSIPRR